MKRGDRVEMTELGRAHIFARGGGAEWRSRRDGRAGATTSRLSTTGVIVGLTKSGAFVWVRRDGTTNWQHTYRKEFWRVVAN